MDIPNLSPEDKAKKLAEIQAKMAAAKAAKMAIGGSPLSLIHISEPTRPY